MRILLVGEFSRLHNSLKEGLIVLGHEVQIIGTGDDFKKFPVDFSISSKIISSFYLFRIINKITKKILKINLEEIERGIRFKKLLPKLKGYDVVQLINSDAIESTPKFQEKLYRKLFSQNHKNFLLICGDETPIIEILLKNNLKYSVLTPLFENSENKKYYNYTLKYTTNPYKSLFNFLKENCDGFFASDLDYKIPLEQTDIHFTLIPNPINTDKISFIPIEDTTKIIIFHGINKFTGVKKGSPIFSEALELIQNKYAEKVEIIIANSISYDEFTKLQNRSMIVLDQIYCFDQGYNALEAMAKGKAVFTGAESEFYDYYNLQEIVAINALPDINYLFEKLSYLIENPEEIKKIGQNARTFIEKEHDYIKIAEKYIENWKL